MKTLIVGAGALGGVIAARLRAAGERVRLATRTAEQAAALRERGLRVSGIGGTVAVDATAVAEVGAYSDREPFDLVLLATKAHDAIAVAPVGAGLLASGGTLLPFQNGGVSQIIADRLGHARVLGGLSNLGAAMTEVGIYEQTNAGYLLIGELPGGDSVRAERVREWLARAVDVRVTTNLRGAVWSKLIVNCSVTTIGAIVGMTMREYIGLAGGRELFDRSYDEALSVALASGARPERMAVDPVPPNWSGRSVRGEAHEAWLGRILDFYGGVKPSMLQDFERGRATEVDFINGYVVDLGRKLGVPTPANSAIVETVHAITRGEIAPSPVLLQRVLSAFADGSAN